MGHFFELGGEGVEVLNKGLQVIQEIWEADHEVVSTLYRSIEQSRLAWS